MIGGLVDSARIAESFADYFCDTCKPNSEETNYRMRTKYEDKVKNYLGDRAEKEDFFTVEQISKLICELKTGKAAGFHGVSAEHI